LFYWWSIGTDPVSPTVIEILATTDVNERTNEHGGSQYLLAEVKLKKKQMGAGNEQNKDKGNKM